MKNPSYLCCFILAILIAAIIPSGCTSEGQSKNAEESDTPEAIPVEAASAERGPISAYYATTATLEADEEASVVSKVRGVSTEIFVEEGDFVEKGELLVQLDDEELIIEANRAKATMDRLYNDYQRSKELYERNLISLQNYEDVKFEYESQKAAYELASLKVSQAGIRAPISGYISRRSIKTGNMVNTDQEVFQITDFDPLLAILYVPEHEMSKLRSDQRALIQADAIPGELFEGEVLRTSPVVDPATGTFKVTIGVTDPSGKLKPGMFGRVRIVYDTREQALMVPKQAVMTEDGLSSVFLVRENTTYRQPVTTGYVNGSNVEVREGLSDGDVVVTVGQSSLQDSTLVQIIRY